MNLTTNISQPARLLVIAAGLVIIFAGMKAAASIIGPIIFSLFLTLLFSPVLSLLKQKGLSDRLAAIVTITCLILIAVGVVIVVGIPFYELVEKIPEYQDEVQGELVAVQSLLDEAGLDTSLTDAGDQIVESLPDLIISLLPRLIDAVTALLIIIITTSFLLFETDQLSAKMQTAFHGKSESISQTEDFISKLVQYVIIRTKINLATGIGIGVILAAVGVDYAIVWGFLAFILSYIPYLGFWLAVIPPTLIALIEFGPLPAAIILIGAGIVNIVAENVLFPHLAGQGLKISPAVVFISLIFWGFILGALGALLAVPLTLIVRMVLDCCEETRWMAPLIDSGAGSDA